MSAPNTILLLHFDEPDGIHPSDAAGNLDDLATEPGIAAPTSATAWTGKGRAFDAAAPQALLAADLPGQDTLLTRDVSIRALLSLTLAGAAGPKTVIARGLNDGSVPERYAYGLELEESAHTAGMVEVRLFHQDSAGIVKTMPAGVYQHAGDGKEVMITATRRWEHSGKVVVRYYVADEMIAEVESADGDISSGTTGTTSIGGRKAAGVWGRFFHGTIDELEVLDYELTPEEVRQTWKRLTVYQPDGVAMVSGLVPPGLPYAANPGNNWGKRVKVAGQAHGLVTAAVEEMRAMLLPDKAPLALLSRWERIHRMRVKARDSLDQRRERLLAFMGAEHGFDLDSIKADLNPLLDAPTPDDLEILEFTNTVIDGFDTLEKERWIVEPAAEWTIVAGQLRVDTAVAVDHRWSNVLLGRHVRTPIDRGGTGSVNPFYVSAKIAAWTLAQDTGIGILLTNRRSNNTIWFGVYNNAGVVELGYRKVLDYALGAWTALVTPWAAPAPVWLRAHSPTDDGFIGTGQVTFKWSTIGPGTAGFDEQTIATGIDDMEWAGFGLFGDAAAAAASADVDDFVAHCRNGNRPFHWYAFRDPALVGAPDVIGAEALVQRIKPAHTFAGVCKSTSVICDDPEFGLCDIGPLGAL